MFKFQCFCGLILACFLVSCQESQNQMEEKKEANSQPPAEAPMAEERTSYPAGSDSLFTIPVLQTGQYGEADWDASKLSNSWMGLFLGKKGYYLAKTELKVSEELRFSKKDPEQKIKGKNLQTQNDDSCLILMESQPFLNNHPIPGISLKTRSLDPGVSIDFDYLGHKYHLMASGFQGPQKEGDELQISSYKLFLTSDVFGKQVTELIVSESLLEEITPQLIFAGDIDGDGLLDLVIDISNHGHKSIPALYLSKPAAKGNLLKPVGAQVRSDI
jgi:hypothetical protein